MKEQLQKTMVSCTGTLRDAMMAIERGASEIALVVNDKESMVGTLTDGDVRRALLSGAALDSPLEPWQQKKFKYVRQGAGRAEVMDLMKALTISQVPELDDKGRVLALHRLVDTVGHPARPNCAVIMAGGKGTRLGALTQNLPKPMIHVAGRPILERLVLHVVSSGIRHIYLSINYLGHMVEEHFGDGSRFGCKIEYLRERKPLGTGGALGILPVLPEHPIVVMNGDVVTQADLGAMLRFHDSMGYKATMGVREYTHSIPFGCVEVGYQGQLHGIVEKPTIRQDINAGIYVISPSLLTIIPQDRDYPITHLFAYCLDDGAKVGAFRITDDWIDVGQPEQLRQARTGA